MEYESPFGDEKEYNYDTYGNVEELEEIVGRPLTIAELRKFMDNRTHVTYSTEETDLILDEQTGLYYTDELFVGAGDLLIQHILVEQCVEQEEMVDWQRVTCDYDYRLIDEIESRYKKPLTWCYPSELIGTNCIIWGLAVTNKCCEERSYVSRHNLWDDLRVKSLLRFADNLPTRKSVRHAIYNVDLPDDIILWDRLCATPVISTKEEGKYVLSPDTLRRNIDYIAQELGSAKAAEIIRLFRDDWKDIKLFNWFGLCNMSQQDIDEFELCLFAGMDRSLRIWDAETPDTVEEEQHSQDPDGAFFAITDKMTYDMCKKELLRVINGAKNKAAACREILRSETVGYFVLSDKTDQEKANAINPWVVLTNKKYQFTGDDFRKARNS